MNFLLDTPISKLSENCLHEILFGTQKLIKILGENGVHQVLNGYEGVCNFILRHHKEGGNKIKRWAANFLQKQTVNNVMVLDLKIITSGIRYLIKT